MGNVSQSKHCRCLCAPICIDKEKTFADDLELDSSGGTLQVGTDAHTRAKRIFASSSSVFRSSDVALDDEADPLGIEAALLVHASLLPIAMSGGAVAVPVEKEVEETESGLRLVTSQPELTDGFCESVVGEENADDLNGTERNVQLVFSLNGGLAEIQPAEPAEAAASGTSTPRLRTVSFSSGDDESFAGFQELAPKVEGRYQDDEEGNETVMEEKSDSVSRQMQLQGFKRVKAMFV